MKSKIKQKRGIRDIDLQVFLDEQMWRDWYGLHDIFANFLLVIRAHYPVSLQQAGNYQILVDSCIEKQISLNL